MANILHSAENDEILTNDHQNLEIEEIDLVDTMHCRIKFVVLIFQQLSFTTGLVNCALANLWCSFANFGAHTTEFATHNCKPMKRLRKCPSGCNGDRYTSQPVSQLLKESSHRMRTAKSGCQQPLSAHTKRRNTAQQPQLWR